MIWRAGEHAVEGSTCQTRIPLLAQERVFWHQFRLASRQVKGCIQHLSMVVRLCPRAKALFDSLAKRIYTVSHEGEEWKVH